MLSDSSLYALVLLQGFVLKTNVYNVCMNGHHIQQSMDQPGKAANPARGQLNTENEDSPVPVRA